MPDTERFIPGIHDYCDGWCERCLLSHRCGAHASATQNLRAAAWRGREFRRTPPCAEALALIEAARLYHELVRAWFDTEQPALEAHADEALHSIERGTAAETLPSDLGQIIEALDVIAWYQYRIEVKLTRAAIAPVSPGVVWGVVCGPNADDPVQTDANGSAKAALIGIDRSTVAWRRLRGCWPDLTTVGPLVDHLVQLERSVECVFPLARRFTRPGFDTGELPGVTSYNHGV